MGFEAGRTILDTLRGISKITATVLPQAVQRAVAEQATEGCGIRILVAWEIFTLLMLKKIVIRHCYPSFRVIQ
jgi:hypothetical protein